MLKEGWKEPLVGTGTCQGQCQRIYFLPMVNLAAYQKLIFLQVWYVL